MTLGPRTAVTATGAAAPRTGLIASSRSVDRFDEGARWEDGFAFEPENYCSGSGVMDPCNVTTKTADATLEIVEHDPLILWASDKCSSQDRTRDRVGRARRRLLACQSKLLAGEFWEGTVAQANDLPNKRLASPAANTLSSSPMAVLDGMACLEEALADCSCSRAAIHVTPATMIHLATLQLVIRTGDVFVTANDTLVIADAGYTGTGPEDQAQASGSVWAYGTDVPEVRLSEILTFPRGDAEAMNMQPEPDNTLTYRAERLASATWDGCCHVAVQLNVTLCAHPQAS